MSGGAIRSVGVAGLGLMGRPMAANLARAGFAVSVWNRSPGPAEDSGLTVAASPRALAETCDIVLLMVADTAAVDSVLHGPDGVLAGLRPDRLVVDMGSTAVTATRAFAAEVEAAGGAYVDAPVSGGDVGARDATLTIMAGGAEDAVLRAMPLFRALGQTITHVGGTGAGQAAKMANQVIVGLTIGAVAEAMVLARRAGVDPGRLREALGGGFAASRVLELHGQRMVDKAFAPGAKITTQHKDMAQALKLAEALGLDLPATAVNKALYEKLIEAGEGALDHAALVRAIDDWT